MGFQGHGLISVRNNLKLMKRSSQLTRVNTGVKKEIRKQSRYKNHSNNKNSYELTKAYKKQAFKRDVRVALITTIGIFIIAFFTIKCFGV